MWIFESIIPLRGIFFNVFSRKASCSDGFLSGCALLHILDVRLNTFSCFSTSGKHIRMVTMGLGNILLNRPEHHSAFHRLCNESRIHRLPCLLRDIGKRMPCRSNGRLHHNLPVRSKRLRKHPVRASKALLYKPQCLLARRGYTFPFKEKIHRILLVRPLHFLGRGNGRRIRLLLSY